jgi:Mg-chelatase subunit ChlD
VCNYWHKNLEFIRKIIQSLVIGPYGSRVGVATFANTAQSIFHLDAYNDMDSLLNAVNNIPYTGGETNTTGGFQVAMSEMFQTYNGNRKDVTNVCIVITDGMPNIAARQLNATAIEAHKVMQTLAVGVGTQINDKVLQLIASQPAEFNQQYFTATSYSTLDTIREALARQTCAASAQGNYYK